MTGAAWLVVYEDDQVGWPLLIPVKTSYEARVVMAVLGTRAR